MMQLLFKINTFDRIAILAVASWRKKAFTFVLKGFTYSARGYAWITYVILLFIALQMGMQTIARKDSILWALCCVFMTWVIGNPIKKIVKRKRPFQELANFPALVHSPIDDSFPSLHAASTTAFFIALLLLAHPWAYWVGAWAIIVIFSRLYLGVHYPSDLLGGILLGILCGHLIHLFV